MGSRDKDSKSLQDKLKNYFKKGPNAPLPARQDLAVSAELVRALGRDTPLPRRLKQLRETADKVLEARLAPGGAEKLWSCTRDLLNEPSAEARHAEILFLCSLLDGQGDQMMVMRNILFRYLREHLSDHPPEDSLMRFKLLHTLTKSGKDISCVEEQIGSFLLEWLPLIESASLMTEFLQLVTNVVKFNATYLDEDIVHGIVNWSCHVCCWQGAGWAGGVAGGGAGGAAVHASLALLEAVVSYSMLPRAALPVFVRALARTVNVEHYCQNSWKVMRYVLGQDLGYAAIQEMVEILQGEEAGADAGLLRGAVFYINMALWGARRVPTLQISYLAVLPAFAQALTSNQPVVTYEVLLAIQSLVSRASAELDELSWELVLELLVAVVSQSSPSANQLIHRQAHTLLTTLESMADSGQYCGDKTQLLDLIDMVGHDRPESSTIRLINQRISELSVCGTAWLESACALVDKYVRREPRVNVRLHALNALHLLARRTRQVYSEEMTERVLLPLLSACAGDAEAAVRGAAARAAAEAAVAAPPGGGGGGGGAGGAAVGDRLVQVVEGVLQRPRHMYVTDTSAAVAADADPVDVRMALAALLDVFHSKLLRSPGSQAARAFLVLLDLLELSHRGKVSPYHPAVRLKIMETVLGIEVSECGALGYCYEGKPVYSPFLYVEPARRPPPQMQGACCVSWWRVVRAVSEGVRRERCWRVLAGALPALPALYRAAPAAAHRPPALDSLATVLANMVTDRSLNLPECLTSSGAKPKMSEFQAPILAALAALAPYYQHLEPHTQQRVVRILLKYGVVQRSNSSQQCITALTIFTLEARETMVKLMPQVLLDLSKISDTKAIACPMLEFLSTLTRLPRVFASFVEDQYMSVFAILLPYTNPSRYNHYVVSLAHHVIAAWFLKCRLAYRRNFVPFIIHGLHNYVLLPFEEERFRSKNLQQQQAVNEDSSNRKRSSSLGSRGGPATRLGLAGAGPGPGAGPAGGAGGGAGSTPASFHVELTETCVDLLARYAYSVSSVKPQRSPTVDFLLNGGPSVTWLVGHKLITITTSGCQQNGLKQGFCDRCASLCKQHVDDVMSPLPPLDPLASDDDPSLLHLQEPLNNSQNQTTTNQTNLQNSAQNSQEIKRYSKHSLQHSRSTETSSSSLSDCGLLLPNNHSGSHSGDVSRQNSGESRSTGDPVADALAVLMQRIEKNNKEIEGSETEWSRVGGLALRGACPCWCGRWAELRVRSPTGDVAYLLRVQDATVHLNSLTDCPMQDAVSLLLGTSVIDPQPPPLERKLTTSDSLESRSRSSSSASQGQSSRSHQDLHKSSSDTIVTTEKKPPHASTSCIAPPSSVHSHRPEVGEWASGVGEVGKVGTHTHTSPINIPGSLERRDSDADSISARSDGKSRHPVRRSNSSPEMSSSWKSAFQPPPGAAPAPALAPALALALSPAPALALSPAPAPAPAPDEGALLADNDEALLLPSVEPTNTSLALLASKKAAKKSDMRVSCEAIPEEMSGTSPLAAAAASARPRDDDRAPEPSEDQTSAQAAPALHLQKGARAAADGGGSETDELPPLARSKRSNTISVMSPTRRRREAPMRSAAGGGGAGGAGGARGGGVTPACVLLQLYHNVPAAEHAPHLPAGVPGGLNPLSDRPLRVSGVQHERSIKNLDLVPPVETYRIGVLYVGPGQHDDEIQILRNEYGSARYSEFLSGLGSLVELEGGAPPHLFLNLESGGQDGRYTYVWCDDIMQVHFHVATAMPLCARDPNCNEKRKHIGNDHVSIVYNDSGEDFNIHTIKGQLNFCIVVVEPQQHGVNIVRIKTKDERIRDKFLPHLVTSSGVVTDHNVALLARQMALHAALASHISQSLSMSVARPYASNSLERLRAIKRLRTRLQQERAAAAAAAQPYAPQPRLLHRVSMDDFTQYV